MTCMETETKDLPLFKALCKANMQIFWISFAVINLTFLFHTVNFMFGDHDWNYVRTANYWNEGTFEGRPLHFVLQSLFFGGEVLPVLNNLFSFATLTLSGILLARYWQIPFSKLNYTLFTIFVAVLPYTLVWLFYAKDMLINLSLPLICVCGLLIAEYALRERKMQYHLLAIALFYFAFSSYAAVINFLGVCLLGQMMITYANQNITFVSLIRQKILPVADILIALICFALTLKLAGVDSGYNTQTIPLEDIPLKLRETLFAMFTQFVTPLPFMEYKYKLLLLILCVIGFTCLAYKSGRSKIILQISMLVLMLLASKAAFFLADEKGQILAEMENFAYVPRLDFYGLAYIYAFGIANIFCFAKNKLRTLGVWLVVIIAFMSIIRDIYAQKVWKLGFDAEMKTHERIISRLETMPNFDISRRYRLLQVGTLSLRQNYYLKNHNEAISLDLLSTSYTPQYMSRIVYNFYYPHDVFYANAVEEELTLRGRDFLLNHAIPFPSSEALFIDGDIVIVVLTEEGLNKARSKFYR